MFDSTFISCPNIGFDHALEIATKEFNLVNGSPQWDVQYPTPDQPTHVSEAEYDQFVDDVAADMEDQDAECCEFGDECIICSQPDDDQDHCIIRPSPDDDIIDQAFPEFDDYLDRHARCDDLAEEQQEGYREMVAESDGLYDTLREYGEMHDD